VRCSSCRVACSRASSGNAAGAAAQFCLTRGDALGIERVNNERALVQVDR
jgi:hypothetical protein